MRYLIFVLLIGLPFIGGATVAGPVSQGETAIAKQAIPHGFAPKKQRFFDQVAEKFLQKRLIKALGRNDGETAKGLSIFGFVCSSLGIILFFAGAIMALVLILTGAVLSILSLALSFNVTEKWVKVIAIAGILLPAIVLLLLFYSVS